MMFRRKQLRGTVYAVPLRVKTKSEAETPRTCVFMSV